MLFKRGGDFRFQTAKDFKQLARIVGVKLIVGFRAAVGSGSHNNNDWNPGLDGLDLPDYFFAGHVLNTTIEHDSIDRGKPGGQLNSLFSTVRGNYIHLRRLDNQLSSGDAAGKFAIDD